MRYWLVMPAAGVGRRFGSERPKQYSPLAGRTVIEWALQPFLDDPQCRGVVVALAADDPWWPGLGLRSRAEVALRAVAGGAERCDSVLRALQALPAADADVVLVHDAARPCLAATDLQSLKTVMATGVAAALLAAPLADTLKRAAPAAPEVAETVPRTGLWRALTPQAATVGVLRQALHAARDAGRQPTDEAQALEWRGVSPVLVEGSSGNIKITTAADLALAAAVLQGLERTAT
jgi:2-C-methyl-D-erythritol 4-phosphate cytidylyltransferase